VIFLTAEASNPSASAVTDFYNKDSAEEGAISLIPSTVLYLALWANLGLYSHFPAFLGAWKVTKYPGYLHNTVYSPVVAH